MSLSGVWLYLILRQENDLKVVDRRVSRREAERRRRAEVEAAIARTREAKRLAEEERRKLEEQRILAR